MEMSTRQKILIAGAGGAPSEGVIKSLLKSKKEEIILGMGSEPFDLILSAAKKKIYVPYADSNDYKSALLKILNREKPDLVHFQNDLEIFHASMFRNDILATGTKIFMPKHDVIDTCVHKHKSYKAFRKAGITVPKNIFINNEDDLVNSFDELKNTDGKIWLRASSIGGGGKGSIATADYNMAKSWIDNYNGWGNFVAAELLQSETVTWLSIWYHGELIVAQGRQRKGWIHGNRSVSGVTGVTKLGVTHSDDQVSDIAINSIKAVDNKPHGIYGVDMAYDTNGIPNPTEINISRFFTTISFFTEAGLNMPEIFKDLALYDEKPILEKKINPLPDNLLWARGMDVSPRLISDTDLKRGIVYE
jgi:glutathione synthase/RimK-type ligase-like ATP-grasp enzyme